MKNFLLFFALAVTISFLKCMPTGNVDVSSAAVKAMLFKLVKEKCYQNSTEDELERFVSLTETSTECTTEKVKRAPIFVTPPHDFKEIIQTCFDPLIGELEDCLPEESKDWPQLNLDIFYSLIDFSYENKEQLMSTNFRSYISSCIENFQEDEAKNNIISCLSGYDSRPLVAKVLCQTMDEIENCTMTEVQKRCPTNSDNEELKLKLIAALKEPCAEYEVTENPVDIFTLLAPFAPPNINPDLM